MIAFTEKFTHLGEIARGYTLIVTGNVVLGLASSEDLSEVKICVFVSRYLVVWFSNRLMFVNITGHENLVPQTCLGWCLYYHPI